MIIPTHRPMIRNDQNDLIYLNRNGKYNAIIQEIMNIRGQGVAQFLLVQQPLKPAKFYLLS